jgi:hypothetical protein
MRARDRRARRRSARPLHRRPRRCTRPSKVQGRPTGDAQPHGQTTTSVHRQASGRSAKRSPGTRRGMAHARSGQAACWRCLSIGRNRHGRTGLRSSQSANAFGVELPGWSASASARWRLRSKPRALPSITARPAMKKAGPIARHAAGSVVPKAQRSSKRAS